MPQPREHRDLVDEVCLCDRCLHVPGPAPRTDGRGGVSAAARAWRPKDARESARAHGGAARGTAPPPRRGAGELRARGGRALVRVGLEHLCHHVQPAPVRVEYDAAVALAKLPRELDLVARKLPLLGPRAHVDGLLIVLEENLRRHGLRHALAVPQLALHRGARAKVRMRLQSKTSAVETGCPGLGKGASRGRDDTTP